MAEEKKESHSEGSGAGGGLDVLFWVVLALVVIVESYPFSRLSV